MRVFKIRVNDNEYEVEVEEINKKTVPSPVKDAQPPPHTPIEKPSIKAAPKTAPAAPGHGGEQTIAAPMPGTLLDVKVEAGQAVTKGQTLMILEAMKMENEILAPHDCTVTQVNVSQGASVNAGDVLMVLS